MHPLRRRLLSGWAGSAVITFDFTLGALGNATYTNENTETYWDSAGVLQQASANAGRFDHDPDDGDVALGLIVEGSEQNLCAAPRDLTNAAWVSGGGGITTAKDATGVDGSANAATTLTASGANGTLIDDLGTISSAEHTFSARIKRKTGTGRIDMTLDGGSTWTEITSELSTGEWARPFITQTLADPDVGFRIVTSGDEIIVDVAQAESHGHPTSEILTGEATRAANTLTIPVVADEWNWVYVEPMAMTTADSRWVRKVVITNVDTTAETCDVEVFYTDPTDNSEASVLLEGESLTSAAADLTVESVTETSMAADTSHLVDMPATVNSGDLLIILIAARFNSAEFDTPSGWTLLNSLHNNVVEFAIYAKDAAGTEGGGTVDVTSTSSVAAAAQTYRISGWGGTLATDVDISGTLATGASTAPNPASVTAGWGSHAQNLFIACGGAGDDDETWNAAPTNYTNLISTTSGGGINASGSVGSARRTLEADTDDPGTFTISASESWVAGTIVVKPAAA